MLDLYVYYKVRAENAARLEPQVRAMQARLAVPCQLKRRPESKDDLQTWMEVYPATGTGFAQALAAAEREAGLANLIDGPRRIEVFTDMTPCA
jgi:hypothetical protein